MGNAREPTAREIGNLNFLYTEYWLRIGNTGRLEDLEKVFQEFMDKLEPYKALFSKFISPYYKRATEMKDNRKGYLESLIH
ncbi:hypothetical protein HYX04_00695 [Candidatus Woesearchaeota archaeon]|nr:hypothetical protein [Candidatus Woesearchaeota archaeon]